MGHASGTINEALELIGTRRPIFGDRFDEVGFGDVRDHNDLLDLVSAQASASNKGA